MPRKRGLYGTSPPSVQHRYAMAWAEELEGFLKRHVGKLSCKECEVMTSYPWGNLSIPGLWSWRGKIWAKYEGNYPEAGFCGFSADDSFFDKDYICTSYMAGYGGEDAKVFWYHHGRRLTERSRLWKKRPMP